MSQGKVVSLPQQSSGRVNEINEVKVLRELIETKKTVKVYPKGLDPVSGIVVWCDLNNLAIRVEGADHIQVFVKDSIIKWVYDDPRG